MKVAHLVLLLLMNMCWATIYSAYKFIEHEIPAEGAAPAIVTIRFGLAALCLLLAWPWLPGPSPKGKDFGIACLMGLVLFVLGQRLQVYGNQLGSAGNSSVLMAVEPLMTSVAGAIFFRERIGPRRFAGFLLALCGVAVLNRVWQPGFQITGLLPSVIFLSSFVCESAYSVLGKPVIMRVSVMKVLAVSLAVGVLANLAIDGGNTVRAARQLSPYSWVLMVWLAVVCTAIGYAIWFIVIRECPMNVAALTIFAQSVFGILFAAMFVGEKLHWGHLFGSLVIVGGLGLGLSRQISHAPKASAVSKAGPG